GHAEVSHGSSVLERSVCWRTYVPLLAAPQRDETARRAGPRRRELGLPPARAEGIRATGRVLCDLTQVRGQRAARLGEAERGYDGWGHASRRRAFSLTSGVGRNRVPGDVHRGLGSSTSSGGTGYSLMTTSCTGR